MRRRRVVVALEPGQVPLELAAGRCLEVWAADVPPARRMHFAWRRWDRARDRWLYEQGIRFGDYANYPRALSRGAPWSFETLRARDPEELAEALARRGLPPHWTPVPAGPEWDVQAPQEWYAARGPSR